MRTDDNSVFGSLQQVAGVRYNRAQHNRDIIDTYVLRKAREKGIRLPTGGPPEEYKYLGAWVETSTAGMNENVTYIDVGSMYPSFLMSLNASPETVVGTQDDLVASEYTEEDCVWGYIDTRPVKHLDADENYQDFTDGTHKIVYDPNAPEIKWTCDNPPHETARTGDGPQYERLYFVNHETQKGFLTECVEELIDLKNQYRGTSLYGSTKRVTNCYSPETEVVRADGRVTRIADVSVGDYLKTVEPNTEDLGMTRVDRTYEYEYDGVMLHIQNRYIDLTITPDHFLPVRPVDAVGEWTDEFRALPAGLLDDATTWELPFTEATFVGDDVTIDESVSSVHCVELADMERAMFAGENKHQPSYNSIYGVLGFATEDSSFRLFDWRIAEAITLCGRKMIQHSRDYVLDYLHANGYEDAYSALGDTDGVGIAVPSAATRHEALSIVEEAVEQLNGPGYDEFFEHTFNVPPQHHHGEIEVESYAPKVFIPSRNPPHSGVGVKKRRIEWQMWDEDDGEIDEIDITGLEATRSDIAPVTREAQELFAETLRMGESEAREWLFPQLREMADTIENGDVRLTDVCKRGGIGQDLSEYGTASRRAGPLYRGAKYANKHIDGTTIQRGDKPAVVYVKHINSTQYPSTYSAETAEDGDEVDAVSLTDPSRLPDRFVVDWDKHLQKTLLSPLKPLLDTRFGQKTWDDIRYDHEQAGVTDFC